MRNIKQFLQAAKRIFKTALMMSLAMMGVLSDTWLAPATQASKYLVKRKPNILDPVFMWQYGMQRYKQNQYNTKGIPITDNTRVKNQKIAPDPFVPFSPENMPKTTTNTSRPPVFRKGAAPVNNYQPIPLPTETPGDIKSRAMIILTDYVNQMRAAGFSDYDIEQSLKANRNITVPDVLPEGFGQQQWTTGMREEFARANKANTGALRPVPEGIMPGLNEYLNYMPGYTANRLPSYSEYSGQDTSPYYNMSGKFSQGKTQNLRTALENYSQNYEGARVQPSQYAYEAGIAGLPQDIGQQFYQEFLAMAEQRAQAIKAAEMEMAEGKEQYGDYRDLILKYPGAGIQPTDTLEEIEQKLYTYNQGNEAITKAQKFIDEYRNAEYENEDFIVLMEAIRQGQPLDVVMNSAQYQNLYMTPDLLQALYMLMGRG